MSLCGRGQSGVVTFEIEIKLPIEYYVNVDC